MSAPSLAFTLETPESTPTITPTAPTAAARIVFPDECPDEYQALLASIIETRRPLTEYERDLAQTAASSLWRLRRIAATEADMFKFEINRLQQSADADSEKATDPSSLFAQAFINLTGEGTQPLTQLHRQEARLRRQYERSIRELRLLVDQREENNTQANQADQDVESPPADARYEKPLCTKNLQNEPRLNRRDRRRKAREERQTRKHLREMIPAPPA